MNATGVSIDEPTIIRVQLQGVKRIKSFIAFKMDAAVLAINI